MKRIIYILPLLLLTLMAACHSNENYDQLPDPIVTFITEYWPDPNIAAYVKPTADTYVVTIKNGPTLTFNGNYEWTEVNGNGLPLPQVFLYDRLPDKLYSYLDATEALDQVFDVKRTALQYDLKLLDSELTYIVGSGDITVK